MCSQPYLVKFVLHDNTHFKRKRSQNSARSLNCTKWKSAFTSIGFHFCFYPHFVMFFASLLVLCYTIRFIFPCLHFVLFKSIWLAFILSRDVFVFTRSYKSMRGFPNFLTRSLHSKRWFLDHARVFKITVSFDALNYVRLIETIK